MTARAIRAAVDRIFRRENIANGALRRWTLLRGPAGRALYLHHFRCADARSLHDHPKRFASILLRGGYVEETANPAPLPQEWPFGRRRRQFRAPCVRSFEASHLHRIRPLPGGCWTLVLVGPKVREWGFVHNDEWIHWRRWHEVYDERGGC
ncbi:MAG: hypothetical protein F4Y47_00170 [Acidobacteriia bacterium]|nr:hypothetical protein [Terriglobia bacterium]MYG04421.1 hypothetical protein [Terriglobia bacterium]MYK11286.1 hypothetical protein [Terriglobia bacterium]